MEARIVKVAFVGFGNVGQALARLLLSKEEELQQQYGVWVRVTGIATGRHGIALDLDGIDLKQAIRVVQQGRSLEGLSAQRCSETDEFLKSSQAEVLFESIPVNYQNGQPALDILRQALFYGMHAITANKGPVVHGYTELVQIAEKNNRRFLFEATVMDGAPVFSLFRHCLPAIRLQRVSGILNSTTNFILTRMEQGERFEQAVRAAQAIGIAETDPSGDIDGWDSAIKLAALATVLMGFPLKPQEVERVGIRGLTEDEVQGAFNRGQRWKLVCRAWRDGPRVYAKVAPELVGPDSPMYNVEGTSSIVQFETDTLGQLTLLEHNPSPNTTAYGLFADFIQAICSG
ncbi:MAG: homoserine dehydrogenase [Anaerolineales bacterium]|nr:homoserine dehydrogenase [Anaerolineales bacterium]MDW8160786.1 homoserine dehydrogenase [Anaerolineales bacterium]